MKMLNTHEIVASKMKTGLTKESDKIAEIGQVLVGTVLGLFKYDGS